jgi:hypothetical protein
MRPATSAGLALLSYLGACSGDGGASMRMASNPRRVTITGRADGGGPVSLDWLAFQDGDGPWKKATAVAGVYTLDVVSSSGRWGAAFVCGEPQVLLGEVVYATLDELSQLDVPCPIPAAAAPTVNWAGSIAGATPGSTPDVIFASREAGAWRAEPSADQSRYAINLPVGTYDLGAALTDAAGNARLIIKRDVAVNADGTTDVDFAALALTPKRQPLGTIAALSQETLATGSFVTSPRGARLDLLAPDGSVALLDAADLPAAVTQAIYVEARADPATFRGVFRTVPGGPPPALTLPPVFADANATVAAANPTLRPKVTFSPYPNPRFFQIGLRTGQPNRYDWIMNVGASWLGGLTSIELPDLSAIPGFDALTWGPRPDLDLAVEMTAITSTRAFGPVLHDVPPPSAGDEITYAKKVVTVRRP